jgi:hypothetical protein
MFWAYDGQGVSIRINERSFFKGAQEFAKDHYIDKEKCEGAPRGG